VEYDLLSNCQRVKVACLCLPLAKVLASGVKIGIHEFRRNAEPAKHLDGKVSKVGVSTEHRADRDEQQRVQRGHDDKRANAITPRSLLQRSAYAKTLTDRGAYHLVS
jgi:hypothetical protein